jgi:predicted ABC-type transport system involved in lysophospholipase L1 biosynthesis ATPase subunit
MNKPLLAAQGLIKEHRAGWQTISVLRELSFSVRAEEFVVIRGASGCGKSTLLQVLSGIESYEQGEIAWQGESMKSWSREKMARWRRDQVGFIFQSYHLLPELSALENVELPARLAGCLDEHEGRRLLERVGLAARSDHRPAELSGGEQQRVAIARALRLRPALLFADEPTGNLDRATGEKMMALLLELRAEHGMALVLVTHDEHWGPQAQRTLVLADGQLHE